MAINHTRSLEDLGEHATLEGHYKGKRHTATLVRTRAGDLVVRYRGKRYPSLSAAGEAVMGGISCNGWRFWSLADTAAPVAAPARRLGAA